jgi:hypothetical protein
MASRRDQNPGRGFAALIGAELLIEDGQIGLAKKTGDSAWRVSCARKSTRQVLHEIGGGEPALHEDVRFRPGGGRRAPSTSDDKYTRGDCRGDATAQQRCFFRRQPARWPASDLTAAGGTSVGEDAGVVGTATWVWVVTIGCGVTGDCVAGSGVLGMAATAAVGVGEAAGSVSSGVTEVCGSAATLDAASSP